jgi:non-ribosomal peptide synthetase component E (peptide arylation enzyme)
MDPRLARLDRLGDRPAALYRKRGWWGEKPLWQRVQDRAREKPERLAVIGDHGILTYAELWQDAVRCAKALCQAGLERRDIILVQLPNWHEYVALAVAAETVGVVFAFCPIQWGLRETARALSLVRPKVWFTTAQPRQHDDRSALILSALASASIVPPAVVLVRSPSIAGTHSFDAWCRGAEHEGFNEDAGGSGSDPLEIAVTSGSTGDSKGVVHVHDTALASVQSTIRRQQLGASDVVHLAVPVGHTFGYFYGVRCALQAGGTLVLQEKWDAQGLIELVARHGITVSLGPSAFMLDLLSLDDRALAPLERLRVFTLAGDALPAQVAKRATEKMPFRISRAFGMTEFGHAVSTDATSSPAHVVDSVGTPQPEMELRITDDKNQPVPAGTEGHISMRGPFLFAGYLTPETVNQDVLDSEGFFDTGDLGFVDDDGFLHLTGRVKNVIRRGAETIPVSLLEDVIATHPEVLNAVVVGRADSRLGEVPVACVQMRPGKSINYEEMAALFEREGVTKKFWPIEVQLFTEWPLGPTGKIDRRLILARILEKNADRA